MILSISPLCLSLPLPSSLLVSFSLTNNSNGGGQTHMYLGAHCEVACSALPALPARLHLPCHPLTLLSRCDRFEATPDKHNYGEPGLIQEQEYPRLFEHGSWCWLDKSSVKEYMLAKSLSLIHIQ